MINKERATLILSKQKYGSLPYAYPVGQNNIKNSNLDSEGITQEEDKYIKTLWKYLPGTFSYIDVLLAIKNSSLNNEYYCYCFKKDENNQYQQTYKELKTKPLEEIFFEATNSGLVAIEDSRKYLPELIEKWNRSQSKDSDLFWHYSIDELSDLEIKNLLNSL